MSEAESLHATSESTGRRTSAEEGAGRLVDGLAAKRLVDVVASAFGLLVLAPVLFVLGVAVKLSSPGPVIFRQERVGLHGELFDILKFRTMRSDVGGSALTKGEDDRITPVGQVLRRFKLDELPQLVNVLRGDMSLVGPRPEVAEYVDLSGEDYDELLTVRPGITDYAALAYRDESDILTDPNRTPETIYLEELLPLKIALSKEYIESRTMLIDLRIIVATLIPSLAPSVLAGIDR